LSVLVKSVRSVQQMIERTTFVFVWRHIGKKSRILFGLSGLIVFVLGSCSSATTLADYYCAQDTLISKMDVGKDITLIVSGASCWEITRPVYIQFQEKKRTIYSYMIAYDAGEAHTYGLLYSPDKSVVGVIETTVIPYQLVMIYNVKTKEAWAEGRRVRPQWNGIVQQWEQDNPLLAIPAVLQN
jgi:hypothetical protein